MKRMIGFVVMLLVALGTATSADQGPVFHGIKLGFSLSSQFQACPWKPPKEGDIPKDIIPPDKDEKGNTIPCFHDFGLFNQAAYPQLRRYVQLYEHFTALKDAQGNVLKPEPLLGPIVYITLLVPPSTPLRDGTVEQIMLGYLPLESDRIRDDLIKKFGPSHPPENKVSPKKYEELTGNKFVSAETWDTAWGKVSLGVSDKSASVIAITPN